MSYILKYKTLSKYFHYVREATKEFDDLRDVVHFIRANNLEEWTLYAKYLEGGNNE
ncbi:MAG: hypothetical protein J6T15_03600 [Bacilli bacterium]|nr:hypothetical protein [Bacilli bacterium]